MSINRTILRLPVLSVAFAIFASTAFALQGVIEQTVITPDRDIFFGFFKYELKREQPVDATNVVFRRASVFNGGHGVYPSWASGYSGFDAESWGDAEAQVAVSEGLDMHNNGNYSGGDGMRSAMKLASTQDIDEPTITFTPADNPYGVATVEITQKVYVTIKVKFVRDDADDQTKYFYFRVVNTMVDGGIRETDFQWLQSTRTSTTSGLGGEANVDGDIVGTIGWSKTVDQGVDGFENLVTARYDATKEFTFYAAAGVQTKKVTIDAGTEWSLSIVDDTWQGPFVDTARLDGTASYRTVLGFGRITTIVNMDGTVFNCPKEWHAAADSPMTADGKGATALGNPELTNDRTNKSIVDYVEKLP